MSGKTFRVAMANALRVGPYERPDQAANAGTEWLIVERRGAESEFLLISDAGRKVTTDAAPAQLKAINTLVAILAEAGDAPRFLIVRHLPAGLSVPGSFFPGEGFVELQGEAPELGLIAVGRHAHRNFETDGAIEHRDVPDPTADYPDDTANWHFTAVQRPWAHQS